MITAIDWVSFSVPMLASGRRDERDTFYELQDALNAIDAGMVEALGVYTIPLPSKGRAPYRQSWHFQQEGVTLFTHANLNHALVEISGRGCQRLISLNLIDVVLELVRNRVTRLDLACDMLTGARPYDFVAKRKQGRYKAHSEVFSDSGETCYVGSPKSDRYARVYRYNPPHERAHLLRCEYSVKGESAKLLVDALCAEGPGNVATALGISFGWEHPDWDTEHFTPAEVAVWRPERRKGKTAFWLADTVAPLLVKMHNAGDLDIFEWLQDHVIPSIITSSEN